MTTEMQQFWETRDRLMRTGSVERMETFLTQWQQKMETKGNFLDWASVTNEKVCFIGKSDYLKNPSVSWKAFGRLFLRSGDGIRRNTHPF